MPQYSRFRIPEPRRFSDSSPFSTGDRRALTGGDARRCPCVLCLDASSSMEGEPISELNAGLRRFFAEACEAPEIRTSYEVGIVTFSETAKVLRHLSPLTSPTAPNLEADGGTSMGEALKVSWQLLAGSWAGGAGNYKPWLLLMTDGEPTDEWEAPANLIRGFAFAGRLVVLAVGIGPRADMDMLSRITTPQLPPIRLKDHKFSEFFGWLKTSLSLSAGARRGDQLILPPPGSWDAETVGDGGAL